MIKELDFSQNNYISTSGLSRTIQNSMDPWINVNKSRK